MVATLALCPPPPPSISLHTPPTLASVVPPSFRLFPLFLITCFIIGPAWGNLYRSLVPGFAFVGLGFLWPMAWPGIRSSCRNVAHVTQFQGVGGGRCSAPLLACNSFHKVFLTSSGCEVRGKMTPICLASQHEEEAASSCFRDLFSVHNHPHCS